MNRYRKLIAAAVGVVAILFGPQFLGLAENTEQLTQMILGLLTALGVWGVPNEEV